MLKAVLFRSHCVEMSMRGKVGEGRAVDPSQTAKEAEGIHTMHCKEQ